MSKSRIDGRGEIGSGSGSHSIAGYEYQIDVSVWLALDLVLANGFTQELVLEPASEEDIEADLAETEPGRVVTTVKLDGYRLIVQAKLRSGDAWTVAGLKALLEHGVARPSAATRLVDAKNRYLLVTSAGLNGRTRGLQVRRAGIWPKAVDMSSTIQGAMPSGSAGRVAIVGNQDVERLGGDIKTLLTESFRVPNAKLEECRRALRDEARARIGGAGGGRWTRAQLEQVIRSHDGYIASSPELEHYVPPTNWDELRAAMRQRNAALIIGQSGTGKTMATRKLYDELRAEKPGLTRVAITLGPNQIRDDTTPPPVLYDVEDPWGRYDFDPRSRPWNDQLAQYFSHARSDRMIVATSRLDVARSSGALDTVKPWRVGLEAEHYGVRERQRLYRTRIGALPRNLQTLAKEQEKTVLAELATPLEIQKFFDALTTPTPKKRGREPDAVSAAIRKAHQDSIERTVVDQIEERQDVRAAAVIWGLLKANDKLSLGLLRQIEGALAEEGGAYERGVSPLVNFFVAARNLRQVEGTVNYYHPRVEAGIEQALSRAQLPAVKALRLLIETLTSPSGLDETWGVAAATRLLYALDRTPDLRPQPSTAVQVKIDSWLIDELAKGGKNFEQALRMAEAIGSSSSNVAEAARFLLHRPDRGFKGMATWGEPKRDEAWYARIRADPSVKQVVETFIREVLPHGRDDFRADFVAAVERISTGMTAAFLDAAATAVHLGYISSAEAIAVGALNDLRGFEPIVDAAIAELTPSVAEQQRAAEFSLARKNGEFSEDYAQHHAEDDSGWAAGAFLADYVEKVRATVGWRHLVEHRQRGRLVPYWLSQLGGDEPPPLAELRDAYAVARHTGSEADLWCVLSKAWVSDFEQDLVTLVLQGHPDAGVRIAALTCFVEQVLRRLPEVGQDLVERGNEGRLVEIAVELAKMRDRRDSFDGARHTEAITRAAVLLPTPYGEIYDAAYALEKNATPTLSHEARALLESIAPSNEEVRLFRVKLDEYVPVGTPDDARWLLANVDDPAAAELAMNFAIRHDLTADIEAGLKHKFADVVAPSLTAIAMSMEAPLSAQLLALAENKGSPVGKALVALLDAKPHRDHLPALLLLVRSDWSPRSSYYGEEEDYPIAQAAVKALAKLGTLPDEVADDLYRLAIDTRDSDLRYEIFVLLVKSAASRFQEELLDLALNPGSRGIRQLAAHALLIGSAQVAPAVLKRITPKLLETRIERVASRLLLLVALSGEIEDVIPAAEALAANPKRRVLLLLAIWVRREDDMASAERIARMLPASSVGVGWALAGGVGRLADGALDDLGDPTSVDQVLELMHPKIRP